MGISKIILGYFNFSCSIIREGFYLQQKINTRGGIPFIDPLQG